MELPLIVTPFSFTRNILSARPSLNDTATYPNYTRIFLQQESTQVLHNSFTKGVVKGVLLKQNWHLSYHQFPLLFLHRIFSSRYSICLKCISGFQKKQSILKLHSCIFSFYLLTLANITQCPPLWRHTKSYFFSFTATHWGLFHCWKQAKSSLCVWLLEKIPFFIYCPLALFSQWIPGLNAISQETLPMCTPVIPNRLQTESSASKREKKNLSTANWTTKALLLVLPVLRNHRCTSDSLEKESKIFQNLKES